MVTHVLMKKTQFGSRDLLATGCGNPVEVSYDIVDTIFTLFSPKVFCRLRPPKVNGDDQQTDTLSSCIKVANSKELILYSSEVGGRILKHI